MTPDWRPWCHAHDDLSINGNVVSVRFKGARSHRVTIERSSDGWRLTAQVASGTALNLLEQPELYVWERNRTSCLVGFRIEKYDRLIGEAWVPEDGLTDDEFVLYVRTVAEECDRLEALLTGRDDE